MEIFIGGAWPYANGSLHIGHISSLLPGDVIARYHRLAGNKVCYVSGSDCHGTPITIRAKQENISPEQVSEKYHREFVEAFRYLNFSFDHYGKTSSSAHKAFVIKFHKKLYESKYVYEKEERQAYCHTCNKFLPDRLVEGKCPVCFSDTRAEQCENCGFIIDTIDLIEPICSDCKHTPEFVLTKNLFIAISKLEKEINSLIDNCGIWKSNAISFTQKYINEGLRDRAITRDIDWGISVPKNGYENKKIYIWAENVLGYLSSCLQACRNNKLEFELFWKNCNAKHYYVHGKDNIPFHTIILPALLIANEEGYNLPDHIISSEYLTLEGNKISTSRNWAIWVKDLINRYNPDAIRYYLLSSGPEKRDSDFSWKEFLHSNNSELLGAYGNFINRTLAFINKSFNGLVPKGFLDTQIEIQIKSLFCETGEKIEKGELRYAIRNIFAFVRSANKYFDNEKPWLSLKSDLSKCENTLYNCVYIIVNLATLLEPFIPSSSRRVLDWFDLPLSWKEQRLGAGFKLPNIQLLFERLDKSIIEKEVGRLYKNQ